jgi:hypothetical protein
MSPNKKLSLIFSLYFYRGQIVEKTKDNFINQFSSKYLFNDKIIINNKQVNIKAVGNFAYSSGDEMGFKDFFYRIFPTGFRVVFVK